MAQDDPTVREPGVGLPLREHEAVRVRANKALRAAPGRTGAPVPLPTRTTDGDDLLDVAGRLFQSSDRSSLLIVTAGSLAGSSFFLHQARDRYKRSLYVDLAITDVSQLDRLRSDMLLLDHLHHGGYPDAQRGPYAFLAIKLPQLVARSRLTVVTVNLDWARQFKDAFGISPVALAGASCAFSLVNHAEIAPLDIGELGSRALEDAWRKLKSAGLPTYPGYLSVANLSSGDVDSDARTSEMRVLIDRWIAQADPLCVEVRRRALAVLRPMSLRAARPTASLSSLFESTSMSSSIRDVERCLGGLIMTDGDEFSVQSPSITNELAADHIHNSLWHRELVPMPEPLPYEVVDRAVQLLSNRLPRDVATLSEDLLSEAAGSSFEDVGYGVIVSTIVLDRLGLLGDTIEHQWLQGPAHSTAQPVQPALVDAARAQIAVALTDRVDDLHVALTRFSGLQRTAVDGDDSYWSTAYAWALGTPTNQIVGSDDALLTLFSSPLPTWRFEDVLDSAVTGATSAFLALHEDVFCEAIGRADVDMPAFADLWDGINDGVWRSLLRVREATVWRLPPLRSEVSTYRRAALESADFRGKDVQGVVFDHCELKLADFRDATNVTSAEWRDTAWWEAILRPSDRYALSRMEHSEEFLEWCEDPPWTNPYYPGSWPRPYDDR